ncbi:S-protein homolog 1 [Ziziphus jujuba]|uniref:S-protein homolog n=1 Tax=Ziziphus jujuba TaxID=326968 RepID=A0A6P4ABD6_ZIZJJ|nr:S-protein homolog 1 [Ziziphus jujuba]
MRGWELYAVLFLAWVLVLSTMSRPCCRSARVDTGLPLYKYNMFIVNGLSSGRDLFIHCQSKDDDLGEHNLTTGSHFTWTFRTNFWGTTRFWCYTRRDNEHAAFDVFWPEKRHKWLETRCDYKVCIWTAKDDGFYLRNVPINQDELIHKWEPGW